MIDHTKPLALTNPEAARHLALSTYYLFKQDFSRAISYSRLPARAGDASAGVNLITTLVLARKFDAAAEMAAMFLGNSPIHPTAREGVMAAAIPALYFLGAREGDSSDAYRMAHELASIGNLNPEHKLWEGQPLQGKTLLVSLAGSGLGGMGDHVMCARFMPYVAALGARIIVQCPPLLARLFATIPGVMATCEMEDRPVCDFAVGIMQIPHALGMRGVPLENPFKVGAVEFPQEKHNVGINWGASWVAPYMDRSCALAEYMPISRIHGVALYGIQKGPHQKQLYPQPTGMQVHDLAPNMGDFLDTAACLMSMDAVVTTDNVVGNLSCMLGVPTFVLVPKCADWRWGEGGRAPWYPSARVYQQEVTGQWDQPIARLAHDLTAYLQEHGRPLLKSAAEATPEEVQA